MTNNCSISFLIPIQKDLNFILSNVLIQIIANILFEIENDLKKIY